MPEFGHQWEPYFSRAFDIYTRVRLCGADSHVISCGSTNRSTGNGFQRYSVSFRAVLEDENGYGLKRWEIGEMASKIGQLYYHY